MKKWKEKTLKFMGDYGFPENLIEAVNLGKKFDEAPECPADMAFFPRYLDGKWQNNWVGVGWKHTPENGLTMVVHECDADGNWDVVIEYDFNLCPRLIEQWDEWEIQALENECQYIAEIAKTGNDPLKYLMNPCQRDVKEVAGKFFAQQQEVVFRMILSGFNAEFKDEESLYLVKIPEGEIDERYGVYKPFGAKFREEEKPEILFEDADDLRSELEMLIYAAQDRDAEARRMRYFER